MTINYKILNQYCEIQHITYQEFGKIVGINWNTLYKVITGKIKPGKKSARMIEQWYKKNEQHIKETVFGEPVK